ncbi:MAG: hypothetical protein OEZ39_01955 [Gammaproteobacteria bacterium]|nr:hypothetical protein [Gammaproteobacteria bacterium]MDH5650618.1 hypothetical protein [Gammaproteobacteria bacterium]
MMMKLTLRLLVLSLLVGFAGTTNAAPFYCFKSTDLKKPLRLQFVFPEGDSKTGYVMYQRGTGRIEVNRTREQELKQVPGGRPSEFEVHWQEVSTDGKGGTYIMVLQGARIYRMRYVRGTDALEFNFKEDMESMDDTRCSWNN